MENKKYILPFNKVKNRKIKETPVGITYCGKNRYKVRYFYDNEQFNIGYFKTVDEAVKMRNEWIEEFKKLNNLT